MWAIRGGLYIVIVSKEAHYVSCLGRLIYCYISQKVHYVANGETGYLARAPKEALNVGYLVMLKFREADILI